jgi:hypothetical protein
VVIALALGAALMSIGHHQRPRDVPIAAVGGPSVARALEASAPDQLAVRAVPDLAAARREIDERDVYGAVALGPQGVRELLIGSAASNGVANFLRRTLGEATEDHVPRIADVRPLPSDDASGTDISLLLTVLLIGGSIADSRSPLEIEDPVGVLARGREVPDREPAGGAVRELGPSEEAHLCLPASGAALHTKTIPPLQGAWISFADMGGSCACSRRVESAASPVGSLASPGCSQNSVSGERGELSAPKVAGLVRRGSGAVASWYWPCPRRR